MSRRSCNRIRATFARSTSRLNAAPKASGGNRHAIGHREDQVVPVVPFAQVHLLCRLPRFVRAQDGNELEVIVTVRICPFFGRLNASPERGWASDSRIVTVPPSKSRSGQRVAKTSPRRAPV